MNFRKKFLHVFLSINWFLILFTMILTMIGLICLYSISGGDVDLWVKKQFIRYIIALIMLLVIAYIPLHIWYDSAYFIYLFSLLLLLLVPIIGTTNGGSQRWLDLGFMNLQPSELMKIALIVGLARYYHALPLAKVNNIFYMIPPLLMIFIPALLIFKQPDLGTAILLFLSGASIIFLSGISFIYIILGIIGLVAGVILAFKFDILHSYQLDRILIFLNPDADPLGKGYNLNQAKIALGSGGWSGKGFMQGTQTHLGFLPEQHTDFIFTTLGEEFGFVGTSLVLVCYIILIVIGIRIALNCANQFARLVSIGVTLTFSFYVLINTAMVMGLLPVVGVPLPFISYGGTVILVIMAGFGLLQSAKIYDNDERFVSGDSILVEE